MDMLFKKDPEKDQENQESPGGPPRAGNPGINIKSSEKVIKPKRFRKNRFRLRKSPRKLKNPGSGLPSNHRPCPRPSSIPYPQKIYKITMFFHLNMRNCIVWTSRSWQISRSHLIPFNNHRKKISVLSIRNCTVN